jgi:hypothetical protein
VPPEPLPDVVDEQAPMKSISVAMAVPGARVEIMRDSLIREEAAARGWPDARVCGRS